MSYVADLEPRPSRVRYFGDLDSEGVAIPSRASIRATSLGLPPVEPHVELYRMLLEAGVPQPATSRPVSTSWLGELRHGADALFSAGNRLAQEWVTLHVLQSDPGWLGAA